MFCIYNNVNREIAKCLIFSRVTTFLIRYTVQLNLLFKVHQIHLKRQDKLKEKRHYLALALRALEIVINFILWNTSIRIGVVYSRMTAYMSHRGSLSVLMDIKSYVNHMLWYLLSPVTFLWEDQYDHSGLTWVNVFWRNGVFFKNITYMFSNNQYKCKRSILKYFVI